MKKFIAVLFIALVAVVISPYFIGQNVENKYQNILAQLQKNKQFQIENSEFKRSWFKGSASNTFVVALPDSNSESIRITVDEQLNFGPVMLLPQGIRMGLAHSQAKISVNSDVIGNKVAELISKNVHLHSDITFSGDYLSNIAIDEFTTTLNGAEITVKALSGYYNLVDQAQRVVSNIDWQGLTFKFNNEQVLLGNTALTIDQKLIAGNVYDGSALFSGDFKLLIANIIKQNKQTAKPDFSINNALFTGTSEVVDQVMNAEVVYHIDDIFAAQQHFKQVNLAVNLNQFNFSELQKLGKLIEENPEQVFDNNLEQLLAIVAKLLDDKPQLYIPDFSVETEQGKIASNMLVQLDQNLFNPQDSQSLVLAIQANAKGSAPVAFFEKMRLMPVINQYIEQGFLVRNKGMIQVNANVNKGTLLLNNKKLPLI